MILFFDCETTGKADLRSAPDASHQPRLVQLAALLVDEGLEEKASLNVIVRPDGWEIPEEASEIHGITQEEARRVGMDLRFVLCLFGDMAGVPKVICAHNIQFDAFVLTGEFLRAGRKSDPFEGAEQFCTMLRMKDHCRLPGNYGDYKWPKLQEAYRHAFGNEFSGSHDALADVRACAKLYGWLKEQEEKKALGQLALGMPAVGGTNV